MAKKGFPNLLHVTREEDRHDSYLVVREGGVFDVDTPQPCALYRLVSTGRVQIDKRFIETKKAKR